MPFVSGPWVRSLTAQSIQSVEVKDFTLVQGLVLGSGLAALGDGLVIPKMQACTYLVLLTTCFWNDIWIYLVLIFHWYLAWPSGLAFVLLFCVAFGFSLHWSFEIICQEFSRAFPNHELPQLVFTWAPLEASFVLTTFGILTGLASPAHQEPTPISTIMLANTLRVVATLLAGFLLGGFCAHSMILIKRFEGFGIFNGSASEMLLLLLAAALTAFALGKGDSGHELVPMGFCAGSMFQPELLVIITGASFAHVSDEDVLQPLERMLGEVWTFGQIILFSMLGSKITAELVPELGSVLPVMAVGLVLRFVGVGLGVVLTSRCSDNIVLQNYKVIFCFLCTLPRATIQGALGAVPKKHHFFHGYPNDELVQNYIFDSAQLYILCYSVIGMILLHTVGPELLRRTETKATTLPIYESLQATWSEKCRKDRLLLFTYSSYSPLILSSSEQSLLCLLCFQNHMVLDAGCSTKLATRQQLWICWLDAEHLLGHTYFWNR